MQVSRKAAVSRAGLVSQSNAGARLEVVAIRRRQQPSPEARRGADLRPGGCLLFVQIALRPDGGRPARSIASVLPSPCALLCSTAGSKWVHCQSQSRKRQHSYGCIPRSHDNPEFLWIDDSEVVRDLIAIGAPVPGTSLRRKFSIAMLKSLNVA